MAHRVSQGGHDIPETVIRRRWRHSRQNLIQLLPSLTELRVYDNSADADPAAGANPEPTLVLHLVDREIVAPSDLSATPQWAKPIVAAALKLSRATSHRTRYARGDDVHSIRPGLCNG